MEVILAGTGETTDLSLLVFGLAAFFGLLFFVLWFPGWRRRRLQEMREEEYMQAYMENVGMEQSGMGNPKDAAHDVSEETGSYHKSP